MVLSRTFLLVVMASHVVVAGAPRSARADETDDVDADVWLKVGGNFGVSFHDDRREIGPTLGAEVGYTYVVGEAKGELLWLGATGEVGGDFAGDNHLRFAIGPKVGLTFTAADLRLAIESADGETEVSYNVRLRLTFVLAGLYFGFTDVADDEYVEVGLQLKWPLFTAR